MIGTQVDQTYPQKPAKNNDKLSSLELDILWRDDSSGNPNIERCQDVILRAPNLRSLRIKMIFGQQDISRPMAACPTTAFKFAPNDLLPPIERLSLKFFPVGICRKSGLEHKIQITALRHLVVEKSVWGNLDTFLENLMARGQVCLTKLVLIQDILPNTARSGSWPTALDRFLASFKGLRKLKLLGTAAVPLRFIQGAIHWHSKTLRSLIIHDTDEIRRLEKHPLRGSQFLHLNGISFAFPLLEVLEMDLPLGHVST